MASCPLCGTEMTIDTCPRCVGVNMDGGRPTWRTQAPASALAALQDDGGPDPVPVATKLEEEHGYLPAAAICFSQGIASVLVWGSAAPPDLTFVVIQFATGAMLLKGVGWAKWLVLVGALLSMALMLVAFVLTGSWIAIFAMLPSACVLGAFFLEDARARTGAAAVGVLLAFAWSGLVALRAGAEGADPMAGYAVPGRTFSDPATGLSVAAPPELTLYDLQKMHEDLQGHPEGLLGMVAKEASARRLSGERLAARSEKEELMAVVAQGSLPPQVALDTILGTLVGSQGRVERDDRLVPKALREAGLETQVWRDPSNRALLIRARDGRLVTVACGIRQRAGERLCEALFAGVGLAASRPAPPPP